MSHDGGDQALPSLLEIVKKSNFNWFQIMEVVTVQYQEEIIAELLYKKNRVAGSIKPGKAALECFL